MGNICSCFFDCHVVRACDIKYTTSGVAIGNFSVAVNDSVKKDGQWVEEASFFECIAYGKTAETLKNYVVSGQRMFFNMRPKQERWVDKEGKKRSRVVFVVEDFSFGEKPRGSQQIQGQAMPQPYQPQQTQGQAMSQPCQPQQPYSPPPGNQFEPPFEAPSNDYSIF